MNVDLKVILKPIWDFLKSFKKTPKKTSTTIIIQMDKIEVNVYNKKIK